jgi:hypothetical protein
MKIELSEYMMGDVDIDIKHDGDNSSNFIYMRISLENGFAIKRDPKDMIKIIGVDVI